MTAPAYIPVGDVEDFTRRLRTGEPVDPNRILEIEAAANDTIRRIRPGSQLRRSALNALAAIGDHRRAMALAGKVGSPTATNEHTTTGRSPPPHSATTTEAEQQEGKRKWRRLKR